MLHQVFFWGGRRWGGIISEFWNYLGILELFGNFGQTLQPLPSTLHRHPHTEKWTIFGGTWSGWSAPVSQVNSCTNTWPMYSLWHTNSRICSTKSSSLHIHRGDGLFPSCKTDASDEEVPIDDWGIGCVLSFVFLRSWHWNMLHAFIRRLTPVSGCIVTCAACKFLISGITPRFNASLHPNTNREFAALHPPPEDSPPSTTDWNLKNVWNSPTSMYMYGLSLYLGYFSTPPTSKKIRKCTSTFLPHCSFSATFSGVRGCLPLLSVCSECGNAFSVHPSPTSDQKKK